jgi:perosamine synthetase
VTVATRAARRQTASGTAGRRRVLPYGRHEVTDEDIAAVVAVLRSERLTTGPQLEAFEQELAKSVGARDTVAFSSGTAALHAACAAAGLGPGDEALTSPLTFCATANAALYVGATPVFADVRPDTLTLDPSAVRRRLTPRTKAVLPVDYAGCPAEPDAVMALAERHGLTVIEDACHALGARWRRRPVGAISHMTVFSFHPVKHITTGEGGAVATDSPVFARRLRQFRSHGIWSDPNRRARRGAWRYDMTSLGCNYRLSEIACALGRSQLRRLDAIIARRGAIAARYDAALRGLPALRLPESPEHGRHAWHLYPVRLVPGPGRPDRDTVFRALRRAGLGVNVHYRPVHLLSYYRKRFGYRGGECPVAEAAGEQLITLPLFHAMREADVDDVIRIVRAVLGRHAG